MHADLHSFEETDQLAPPCPPLSVAEAGIPNRSTNLIAGRATIPPSHPSQMTRSDFNGPGRASTSSVVIVSHHHDSFPSLSFVGVGQPIMAETRRDLPVAAEEHPDNGALVGVANMCSNAHDLLG